MEKEERELSTMYREALAALKAQAEANIDGLEKELNSSRARFMQYLVSVQIGITDSKNVPTLPYLQEGITNIQEQIKLEAMRLKAITEASKKAPDLSGAPTDQSEYITTTCFDLIAEILP